MKFLQPGLDWRKINTWTIIGMVITLALGAYSYLIINESVAASNGVRAAVLISLTILVNLIDVNMFRTILHIRKRADAVKFMTFAAVNVVYFQVVFEIIGSYTQFLWASVVCSAMYNICFCYLFIVWFKLFDFVHEGLHEGLEGKSLRQAYNEECDKLGNC